MRRCRSGMSRPARRSCSSRTTKRCSRCRARCSRGQATTSSWRARSMLRPRFSRAIAWISYSRISSCPAAPASGSRSRGTCAVCSRRFSTCRDIPRLSRHATGGSRALRFSRSRSRRMRCCPRLRAPSARGKTVWRDGSGERTLAQRSGPYPRCPDAMPEAARQIARPMVTRPGSGRLCRQRSPQSLPTGSQRRRSLRKADAEQTLRTPSTTACTRSMPSSDGALAASACADCRRESEQRRRRRGLRGHS